MTSDEVNTTSNGVTFTAEEQIGVFGVFNFDSYDPFVDDDKRLLYYNWMADSATTSHVTNMRNAFSKFESLIKPISGVDNAIMYASGRKVDGNPHQIVLKDVLYIPSNPHNLLSLGHWDNTGGNYHGGQNILALYKNSDKIAVGTKIKNHLYKMKNFTVLKCGSMNPKDKI